MTVSSTLAAVTYVGNGHTQVWSFPFKILAEADLQVLRTDAAEHIEVVSSGYLVEHIGEEAGGTVTYPVTGPMLPAGEKLTLRRLVRRVQDLDLQNQGGFFPDVIEAQFDRVVMMVQEVEEKADRAVKVGISSGLDPDAMVADVYETAAAVAEDAAASERAALNAEAARDAAETARLAAESHAAAIALPDPAVGTFIQGNATGDGWQAASPDAVRFAIGAEPANASILKRDETAILTKGQSVAPFARIIGSNTVVSPSHGNGPVETWTIGSSFTFGAPANEGLYVILATNNATGNYTITTSALTVMPNSTYNAEANATNLFLVIKIGSASRLWIMAGDAA